MNTEELHQLIEDEIDLFASVGREAWNKYAQETLQKCPKSMVSPWEETGEWGREGNRRVARAVIVKYIERVFHHAG